MYRSNMNHNVLTALALFGTNYRLILVEHVNTRMTSLGKIWKIMRYFAYRRAAKVISVSAGVDSCFWWVPKHKRAVIYNPVTLIENGSAGPSLRLPSDPQRKWLVGVGRLIHQKGFDLLISAFQRVSSRHPSWQLLILGDGELRPQLEQLVQQLGLSGRVRFPGIIGNPYSVIRGCDLFAMASRYEGFPYALLEAMAAGLPVVYTDCPSGPNEIIRHEHDGILVLNGNVEAFAETLDRLMSSSAERQRLAANAREVRNRFALQKITENWEAVLQ